MVSIFHSTLALSHDLVRYLLIINLYNCFQCLLDLHHCILKGANSTSAVVQSLNCLKLIKLHASIHVTLQIESLYHGCRSLPVQQFFQQGSSENDGRSYVYDR